MATKTLAGMALLLAGMIAWGVWQLWQMASSAYLETLGRVGG